MRRPLKPFVTEYKTTNRRQQSGLNEQPPSEAERGAARLFDPRPNGDADNSYEAAMRAADALFSGSSNGRTHEVEPERDVAMPEAVEAAFAPPAPEKPGGRILRAIDEPPSPEYAALEAAHAPKRRGRKPGSKNKPKVPAADMPATEPAALIAHSLPAKSPATKTAAAKSPAAASPDVPRQAPAMQQVPALQTATAPRNGVRYSWVRDKLRPGEDWKRRRLPRVCW